MAQPEQLTQAQLIDPGLRLAMQMGARPDEEDVFLAPSGNKFNKLIARGALALGLGVGMVAAQDAYDVTTAHAEAPCADNEYVDYWEDYNGDGIKQIGEVSCRPKTPQTTQPPTTTQLPSSGDGASGSGSGGSGTPSIQAPRPTPPTTSPFIEVNNDADAWTITIDKNNGTKVSGWDVDDSSPGLGDAGVVLLETEMLSRGLDPTSLSNTQRLIALTVNPANWLQYLNEILSVPTTTTSTITTTTTSTTTSTLPTTTTFEEETPTSSAFEADEEVSDTTQERGAIVADDNQPGNEVSSEESSDSKMGTLLAIGLSALGLGGLIIGVARRRRKEEETASQSPYSGVNRPIPGR